MHITKRARSLENLVALGALAVGFAAPAGAGYMETVLADNPVAYWRLGETSGSATAADASGHGHTATYGGTPALGTLGAIVGDANTAATLNGSSQYAQVNNAGTGTLVPGAGSWTMECWAATTVKKDAVLMKWYDGVPGGGYGIYCIGTNASGQLYAQIRDDATSPHAATLYVSPGIFDGKWHYIAAVLNRTSNTLSIYVDGQLFGTPTDTANVGSIVGRVSTAPFTIGRSYQAIPDKYFSGSIDEVALYDSALTASDAMAHYLAAIPEPASLGLLTLGGLLVLRRRRELTRRA
ncbi:MAG: LamG domain-containing protein [Lentisphaeria bacterium]